jgi:hypothetical protein
MFSVPTERAVRSWPEGEHMLAPGAYITDGRRLFRVLSQFVPESGQVFASLEDCMTLEVGTYAPDELEAMGLLPVRAPVH